MTEEKQPKKKKRKPGWALGAVLVLAVGAAAYIAGRRHVKKLEDPFELEPPVGV